MKVNLRKMLICCTVILACAAWAHAADIAVDQALPVEIPASDSNIRLVGRFDASEAASRKFAWPASAITLHFIGTAMNMKLTDGSNNRYAVTVDGKTGPVLAPKGGTHLYRLAADLSPGEHFVTLVRRTEAFFGVASFEGVQLSDSGKLLLVKAAGHRIEVIGDSITAGYGNEAADQNVHFTPDTENANLTYGAVAARRLGADFVDIAWSGRKLWPDNTIPEIYDRTLPEKKGSAWDFSYKPEVILINLATNDFGKGNPDEEGWVKAYHAFLDHLREKNPEATIYLATGPMMSDNWPQGQKALSTVRKYVGRVVEERSAKGDKRIHMIEFPAQDQKNGLGADWHPSLRTDELMGEQFAEAIQKDLGWKPVETEKK